MSYTDNEYIIVESIYTGSTSGHHGPIHIRPIPGQGRFKPSMFVACSKVLTNDYPVGTRFKIRAKITDKEGGVPYIYSHYTWDYEIVSRVQD